MQLVKVGEQFYQECKKHETDKELLFNKSGRPCVLIVKLKYKGQNHKISAWKRLKVGMSR